MSGGGFVVGGYGVAVLVLLAEGIGLLLRLRRAQRAARSADRSTAP